ncbi:hypothetical protein A0J61_00344 [Choanephora cucurbitarum]|uniref:Uncharacterized protein n=1 Tax=Choanephora cucurbitarum TaxID=101091 RepID=A0A1C7NRG8_9FUNG|nr:hypothetical protein A0J61_00344 [Choanephora cucurbitarum]
MTIIYTETHLTSDPEETSDSIVFQIALSTITFYCQTHREENISYIKAHKIRAGDVVRIYGILITVPEQYIKVSSIELVPFPSIGFKKRRIDEAFDNPHTQLHYKKYRSTDSCDTVSSMSLLPELIDNSPPKDEQLLDEKKEEDIYFDFGSNFGHYFYYLYGRAQFACSHVAQNAAKDNQKRTDKLKYEIEQCQQETGHDLNKLFTEIYQIATEATKRGFSRLSVVLFVSKVTEFLEKLKDLLNTCSSPIPFGLEQEDGIPLPSCIFEYYRTHIAH